MGIARRKAGTVVRCPTCGGQVVVPSPQEPASQALQQAAGVFEILIKKRKREVAHLILGALRGFLIERATTDGGFVVRLPSVPPSTIASVLVLETSVQGAP